MYVTFHIKANKKFIVNGHFAVHSVKFRFAYRLIEILCQDILIGHCFAH
jgi:hypothetical protein